MRTVLLPPGVNLVAVNKYISYQKITTAEHTYTNLKDRSSQDKNIVADRYPVLAGWGTGQSDEEKVAAYLWQNQRKAELRVHGISVLILEHLFCPVHPGTVKRYCDKINFKFHDNHI